MQLVSKISNLCDHKSPTLQTDRRTDRRHAIPRPRICTKVHCAVKIQQSWQTSALAVHLPLARSTCVVFCLLPSSGIVILVYYLFFCRHQWTTCMRTVTVSVNTVHWFDASCSGTPVNNSITLISPVQSLHFCRWQYMRSSANFRTVLFESQNANPLDA